MKIFLLRLAAISNNDNKSMIRKGKFIGYLIQNLAYLWPTNLQQGWHSKILKPATVAQHVAQPLDLE